MYQDPDTNATIHLQPSKSSVAQYMEVGKRAMRDPGKVIAEGTAKINGKPGRWIELHSELQGTKLRQFVYASPFHEGCVGIFLSMRRDLDESMVEKLRKSAVSFNTNPLFPHLKNMRPRMVDDTMNGKRYNLQNAVPEKDGFVSRGQSGDGTCEFVYRWVGGKQFCCRFVFRIPRAMDEQIDRVNDILKQLLSGQDDQDRIKDFFIEGDKPGVLKLPTMMLMRLNIKDTWVTTVIATRPDTHEIIPK